MSDPKNELYRIERGRVKLYPHPGQTEAWDSEARFTFILAGTQGGKTSFLPWWLVREIERCGAGDYLAVTATFDLFKLKFLPEMQRIFCGLYGWNYAKSERVLYCSFKGQEIRIILRSADSEGGLESATAKAAILDECGQNRFQVMAWEAVNRRLSLSGGRVMAGTTLYNLGWLKGEVYDRWRAGDTDYRVIQFPSIYNPNFPKAEFERARRERATWKFRMFYLGEFDRPENLIFGDFNDKFVVEDFVIPPEWPRFVGIDPGGGVNTCVIWLALNPETKAVYQYRELLVGKLPTPEYVKMVGNASKGERIITYCGGAASEKQFRLDWANAGVFVDAPPIIDVEAGIDRIIALIRTMRLFVFRSCKGTLDQLGTYSRKMDEKTGQITVEINDKGIYHFIDALRYGVIGLVELGNFVAFEA